jgi:hypothetical protein
MTQILTYLTDIIGCHGTRIIFMLALLRHLHFGFTVYADGSEELQLLRTSGEVEGNKASMVNDNQFLFSSKNNNFILHAVKSFQYSPL